MEFVRIAAAQLTLSRDDLAALNAAKCPQAAGCYGRSRPAIKRHAGDRARMRFVEFFSANIRSANTRRSYAKATDEFLAIRQHRSLEARKPSEDVLGDRTTRRRRMFDRCGWLGYSRR